MATVAKVTENECVNERHSLDKGDDMTNTKRDSTDKRCILAWVLLLHMGYRLLPTSTTLNDLELRNDRLRALSLQ